MQCELCGRVCDCRPATVDNVEMMLCPGCMKYGQGMKTGLETPRVAQKPILERIKRPKIKDVYKEMDKDLVPGWSDLIKNARQKKGLTREQLGFKIGERTVTIAKIENGDLRPSDKIIEKLEKELEISLFEKVSNGSSTFSGRRSSTGLTLGDFIKKEDT
jgi:putative transcription factor